MSSRMMKLCLTAALFAASALSPGSLLADRTPDETQQILEKSLSIVEIDRAIGNIEQSQHEIEQSIQESSDQIKIKEQAIGTSRDRAGERIRAYYMGEQEDLIGALFSANNFRDFLTIADYIGIIFDRDQEILNTYKNEYASLKKDKQKLEQMADDLDKLKADLLHQRSRVLALQESVDASIKGSSNPELLEKMIRELGEYWNNIGLYEVRRYFKALDSAMRDFPDFLEDNSGSLVSNGLSYTLTIDEDDLNRFLRSKDSIFGNFSFGFKQDKIIAEGKDGQLSLQLEGHYTISDTPENVIVFHVDWLLFNGLTLPDTTARDLEDEFDLGFYPQQIMPLIRATSVTLGEGKMIVKLKLAL
ncbi:coiled-coil domain-containing protein [Paenibacillus caui]|uniref:coiled-coil domain-containing protein n=1 Tax=Paenibacillus caui TaxID=2873927 RepID=UPI001CA9BFE6|nr:hypothetical protein [Paenibacillus caui]